MHCWGRLIFRLEPKPRRQVPCAGPAIIEPNGPLPVQRAFFLMDGLF